MDKQTILDNELLVVASISGGKDSTAMALYLLYESGIPWNQIEFIFADTGWEHEYTYDQVERLNAIHPVTIVKSEKYDGMRDLLKKRGIPRQLTRFCTQELKIYPIRNYLSKYDVYVSAKGIRLEEGTYRNGRGEKEEFELDYGTGMYSWYPIREYTLQDVWDIHERYNFPRNKLYDLGCTRVGCAPCIFSNKKDIAALSKVSPDAFDYIREIEEEKQYGYFQPNHPKQYQTATDYKGKPYTPIDNVIIWANTDRKDHKNFKPDTEDKEENNNPDEDIQGTCLEGLCE